MLELEERNNDIEQILEGALDLIIERKDLSIKEKFDEQYGLIKEIKTLKEDGNMFERLLSDIPILLESIGELGINFKDKEDLLNTLLKELTYNKNQYIEFLEDKLNIFCKKESICNCCGNELIFHYHNEYVGEYQGFPAYEEVYDEGYCPYGCSTF